MCLFPVSVKNELGELKYYSCRVCEECKKLVSLQWTERILYHLNKHKLSYYFVTFTINDDYYDFFQYPCNYSRHITLMWKRLRKKINGKTIKYYGIIERGDRTNRIHAHAIILSDLKLNDMYFAVKEAYQDDTHEIGFIKLVEGSIARIKYVVSYLKEDVVKRFISKRIGKCDNGSELINYIFSKNYISPYHLKALKDWDERSYNHYLANKISLNVRKSIKRMKTLTNRRRQVVVRNEILKNKIDKPKIR